MSSSLHSPEYKKLTDWLKKQREAKGLTMRELGERMGVSHSFIGKIEQQERRLDIVEYLHYCKAIGIDPAEGILILQKG